MPDGNMTPGAKRARLWIAVGRQRVGKTALLNASVQYFRALGSRIEVWNADQQNRSHTLSTFFADAMTPPAGGLADGRMWIEERLMDQARHRHHAVLDAGGGWTGFSSLVEDVPIAGALSENGIDPVALFCLGPERADLDYLEHFAEDDRFLPKRTMVVLNAGLVLSGRSAVGAFAAIRDTKAYRRAAAKGAVVAVMPPLACMAEVTDRGLSFADAALGKVKSGQAPMGMFDPARVNKWWGEQIPQLFGEFPADWLLIDSTPADLVAPSARVS